MNILFVASVSAIVRDVSTARGFYTDGLGLSFEGGEGAYVFTEQLGGVKHFGLWPLHDAAVACFGTEEWPTNVPVPHASIEFEVPDVGTAAQELEGRGNRLIHGAKTEPWTQVIARLLSPDGLLIGVCHTPWYHQGDPAAPADG